MQRENAVKKYKERKLDKEFEKRLQSIDLVDDVAGQQE